MKREGENAKKMTRNATIIKIERRKDGENTQEEEERRMKREHI